MSLTAVCAMFALGCAHDTRLHDWDVCMTCKPTLVMSRSVALLHTALTRVGRTPLERL